MELIKNFGIDPKLLAAQVVNFLIVLFLLKRFLYKPVLTVLEDRRKMVQQGMENAQKAKELLEKTEEREKSILIKAREDAKIILEEAKQQQQEILRLTQDTTKKQADAILAQAQTQISFEAKETEKRLAAHVSELSIMFLQKSLTGVFTQKEQETVIKNALRKMKKEPN